MSKSYTAAAGDTWAGIAFKLWGEETLMYHLISSNPLYAQLVVFTGGEQLDVPEVFADDSKVHMPPWRQ